MRGDPFELFGLEVAGIRELQDQEHQELALDRGRSAHRVEAAALIKLARVGLNRFFSFGGYGSDSADRTEVTKAALRRGELVSGGTLEGGGCIAVGDTPRDVKAGHGAGIAVVGVATGRYTVDQLRAAGADHALPTLEHGFLA